jgi:hypothetical protein
MPVERPGKIEEHVACFQYFAAVFDRGEIHVHAQPRDASVRVNVKAQVGVAIGVIDGKKVLRIAPQRRGREQFGPGLKVGAGFE